MKNAVLIILIVGFGFQIAMAQSYEKQRTQVFVTNILSNAIIGGVGGAINRKEGEKISRAFARNFLKGSVGGLVKYSAKYQTYHLDNVAYPVIPLNRLYFFLGHSIVMNAARDKKILSRFYCNFYGIDLQYSGDDKKLRARLSIASLGSALFMGLRGAELNLYRSLEQGQLFFDVHDPTLLPGSGQAAFNTMAFDFTNPYTIPSALAHEIVHTYQMYDYFAVSSFYEKPLHKKIRTNRAFQILEEYIVLDYEAVFFSIAYNLYPRPRYFRNYFEFEAQHFWTRSAIKRS